MKLKNFRVEKYPLLGLYVLKYTKLITRKASISMKYLLRLMYEYHVNRRTILFLGLKHSKELTNADLNNHVLLSKNLLDDGVLSNKKCLRNEASKMLNDKNIDLIVIFDVRGNDRNFITEASKLSIPIVLCGHSNEIMKQCLSYNKQIYLSGLNLTKTQLFLYKVIIRNIILKKF